MRLRIPAVLGLCFVTTLVGQELRRPLVVNESRYSTVAGGRVAIDAPPESIEFIRSAKTLAGRASNRKFAIAPDVSGNQVLIGVPLTTPTGDYSVTISAVSKSGEERTAHVSLTVGALPNVPMGAANPPVVLVDGWQLNPIPPSYCNMAPDSTTTFANLQSYLLTPPIPPSSVPPPSTPPASAPPPTTPTTSVVTNSVPAVFFFETCTECPNCSIEELGADLGNFLNSILYTNGTPVPEVDVIAHSIGGLIVRSYLSGKQLTSGVFNPPATQMIRKAVFIATPHFGSYQADSLLSSDFFAPGTQTNELKRGSQFLWDLATWNQFGDDLRATDAIAIIGNAGSINNQVGASDGVVGLTSASLDFSQPGRTRIVNYCHVDSAAANGLAGVYTGCGQRGIAYIDDPSHPSYQIISSFLLDNPAWQNVGTAPSQDPYLSQDGGIIVADVNAADQFVGGLSSVSWGTLNLNNGAATGELFYNDFPMHGSATFNFGLSTCGPFTVSPGVYSAARCKASPSVSSIGPLLPGNGKVLHAGSTITINGNGFGSQQCGTCQVIVSNPQPTVLQISNWSNTSIQAFLPATLTGPAQIRVNTANGLDTTNITSALSSIVAAPSSLQFAYVLGGTIPATQFVQITNLGSVPLNWTASTNTSWLSLSSQAGTAPSGFFVIVSPAGLSPGTYAGIVQVQASGTSNSPLLLTVALTVAPTAILAASPQALTFNYTTGGAIPMAQTISITNSGGGTGPWTALSTTPWLTLSAASGTSPATLSASVNPATLAPGSYSGTVLITSVGSVSSPIAVPVTLVIQAPPPMVTIVAASNGASFLPGFASATWLSIFGANLSPSVQGWQASNFENGLLPVSLNGVSVSINGMAAYVAYVSPAQINVLAPDDSATGPVQVQVTTPLGKSNTFTAQKQTFAPAFFASGNFVAAQHADFTPIGNPGTMAQPGETVLLYGTGFGPTSPPSPTNQTVTAPANLANQVAISIGGQAAQVSFAGLVSPGLYQFNVTVPNLPAGNAAVQAQIGGVQTQTGLSIPVQ